MLDCLDTLRRLIGRKRINLSDGVVVGDAHEFVECALG